MKERIQSFISILEHDPADEKAINDLEELITEDGADQHVSEIIGALEEGWKLLAARGRPEAACKIIEIETVFIDGAEAEVVLLKEMARLYGDELFDQKLELEQLKSIVSLQPDDQETAQRIELIETERSSWKEIVAKFNEQAEAATESSLKAHMLFSAAERTYKNHKRGKEIPTLLMDALDTDPSHFKAAKLLEMVLKERGRWEDLVSLYMKLAEERSSKDERVQMMKAAAYTYGHRLEDMESAAICYAEVLDISPGEKTALKFLVKHYEDREDWDHLAALYEDALRRSLTPDEESAMLMQVGMVHWRMRDNIQAAEQYFKRLRKIQPGHPGMINFYRKFTEENGDKAGLLRVLQDAQRKTEDRDLADSLTKEIAQLAGAEGGNVEKAIDAWKNVLRHEPDNKEALSEIKILFRQSGKWNNLLDTLKSEAGNLPDDNIEEKVAIYEEMADIYRDHQKLEMMVIKTYDAILQLAPENISALNSLTEAYETAGRWNELINILTRRAESSEDVDEKIEFFNKAADLWVERFSNYNRAVDPLERIRELDPSNQKANATLKLVYQKKRAWQNLIDIFEDEVKTLEGEAKIECLKEMAQLASDRLSDHERSAKLWRNVLEIDPSDAIVLPTLEKLYERQKDWKNIASIIELRFEKSTEDAERASHLIRLGTIWKDRVKDPAKAAEAWRRLLEIEPGNAKAMRSLKDAYQAAQDWSTLEKLYSDAEDWETLVEVLGIAADRASDAETKIKLSFRCAELYNDPINQPDRASRHYERVLSVDPKNVRAATALAPIYKRSEKWSRLIGAQEIILDGTEDKEERVLLIDELRELSLVKMNNKSTAFKWAAKAFSEMPHDKSLRKVVEEAAETAGTFEELFELYKSKLDEFEGEELIELEAHIGWLALEKLGAVDDAVERYRSVLEKKPGDEGALSALDNIFRTTGRWNDLISIFEQRMALVPDNSSRRDLLMEMARFFEEGMDDVVKAAERYREVLSISSEDVDALLALERIYSFSEQWTDLVEIVENRRNLCSIGDDDWCKMTLQLAQIFDEHFEDKEKAISFYQELLKTKPGNMDAIEGLDKFLREENHRIQVAEFLLSHLTEAEDWRRLSWVLSILIESSEEVDQRLALNIKLSEIYGDRLEDVQLAFDTLGAALLENPADKNLWERMTDLSSHLDNTADLANRLAGAFKADSIDDDTAVDLAQRLATMYGEDLGNPEEAEPYHKKVIANDPNSTASFSALEEIYTVMERWNDLLDLYKSVQESGHYEGAELELLLKICFIVDEVSHDVSAAINAYRAVLNIEPQNEESLRSLPRLFEEAERWDDLSDLLMGQLDNVSGADAVTIKYRLGEIADHFLGKSEDAIEFYDQVITDDPDHLKTQGALERLLNNADLRQRAAVILTRNYEYQGAAEPLARVLMISIEDKERNVNDQIDILMKVADLKERRLSDPEGAFEVLSEALEKDPTNEYVSEEIARIASENGFEADYCALLDLLLPLIEDNMDLSTKYMMDMARLYDERLGDLAKAEAAYQRLLEIAPDNLDTALPATDALDRLLSGSESWEKLLTVLRTKVDLLSDPMEQKGVLHRMAELEESFLERPKKAVDIFKKILEIDELDQPAIFGLERLYERMESWLDLVEILRRRAMIEESSDMRKEIYLRVARLLENEIGDAEEAIAAYNQVNDEVGADTESLNALTQLYLTSERWRDLYDTYELQMTIVPDSERVEMLYKMGDLLRVGLNEPEQAVEKLGETLSLESGHSEAIKSLELLLDSSAKLQVIEILRPVFEAEGDYERLIKFAEIKTTELDDPLERSQVFRETAEVAEVGLDDPQRAFDFLCRAFRDGTASPDLANLIDNLERMAERVEGYDTLVLLYREVGPDILDGDLQIRCNLQVAQICHTTLDDLDVAREYYVKVLDMDSENTVAMDALEDIYQSQNQHLELFEIYRKKIQTTYDDDQRREILFKQAQVCEVNLEDISGATQTYESILESDETSTKAIEALERLYPKAERWADLMDLLERRVEMRDDGSVELLQRLGELAHDKLGDDERSLDFYARALEIDPSHAETLISLESAMEDEAHRDRVASILEPIYMRQGDWTKLAVALDAQLGYCDDPEERKQLLRRIGTVYEEQLGNLEKAFEMFARLFREDIEDRTSWDLLNRLGGVLENWNRLADVFAEALEGTMTDTPETVDLAFILGEIYEEKLEKPDKAKEAYQRALAFSDDDEKAFSAVERMLLATASWLDLLELYRNAADVAVDIEQRKGFIFKIAEIQETSNNDADAAINAYRDIFEIDDMDVQAITSLERLFRQTERFDDLSNHFRTQIDQAADLEIRNNLRRRLASLYEEHLNDITSAVDVYEEAIIEGEDSKSIAELERLILNEEQRHRIAEILEPLYRDKDEWKKLVVILKAQVEFADSANEKVDKYIEIAQLHENRGGNFLLAFNSFVKAFKADPSSRDVLSQMKRLAEGVESWDDLTATLESVVEDIYDMDFKIEVLHLLGTTYDQQLDMPRKSIEAYTSVIAIDEMNVEALDALENLYNLVGDWHGLVDVLTKKAINAQLPEERAQLLRSKGSLQEELIEAPKDAIDSYRQALEADPTSVEAMDALERLYAAAEDWLEMIDVKKTRLDTVTDGPARIEILRDIGVVYVEKLDDAFEAINGWRAVLDEDPHDEAAIKALDSLYKKESMFIELLENLQVQKEIVQDQSMWVDIGMRIGDLQEKELNDLDGSIDSYRDVLAQQPTHAGAIDALDRLMKDETVRERAIDVLEPLHREAGRNEKLVTTLELKLEILDDPSDRMTALMDLAEIHEIGLSDPETAFDVFARALVEDASRQDIMETLERIAKGEQLWKKLNQIYTERCEDVYNAETEQILLSKLGEIREVQLGDIKGSIEAYRKIMDNGQADDLVMSSLDRLYEREGMWTELDEVLEQEIRIASSAEDINRFKLRQGVIREKEFDDVAGAITVYRDVVESNPENDEAVSSLEALLTKDEFVEDVVEVLTTVYEIREDRHKISALFESRLRVASDDHEKVQLLSDLAVHQEDILGDAGSAFDARAKAFALAPTDNNLVIQLERLAEDLGSWSALVEVTEKVLDSDALDPTDKVELGLKVAGWASTKVGDPRLAEARYRAVLEQDPEHQGAINALIELLQSLGRFEDLFPMLKQQAQVTYDYTDKKEILFKAAKIAQFELGDADKAIGTYREILENDEADLESIDAIIALSDGNGKYDEMVELLLSRAQFTPDPMQGNEFRHRAGTLFVGPLEAPNKAIDVFREILEMNPQDENAISQLEGLFEKDQKWTDLQDLYMQKLDNVTDEQERIEIQRSLAILSEQKFEMLDDAIGHLQDILMVAQDDNDAIKNLERIYTKSERWQDLVELLESQVDNAVDQGDTDAELQLLVRVGEIWDGNLSDSDKATEIYERVLERDTEHTRALAALAKLYEANADWDKVAEVLNKAAAAGRGGHDEAEVHFRLARLNENHLEDPDKALEELNKAVALYPGHIEANRALAKRCKEAGDNEGLLEAQMREEIHLEDNLEKVAKLLEIAQLQGGPLNDSSSAVASLERAKELDGDNKNVLLKLSDAYTASGRQDEAIPLIESLLDAETNGGKKRSKGAAVFHHRLAEAYLSKGDEDRALEHFEGAYKMDISNTNVLISLGKLHYDREDYDKAVKLFRALLLQRLDTSASISKADIYYYVGDISLKQGDQRKAKGMFQRGLDENRNHEGCKNGLAQC